MDTSEMVSYTTTQANIPVPTKELPAPQISKKRKRTSTKPARESLIEAETSDLDMVDEPSHSYNQGPPPPLVSPNFEPDPGDGDFWRPSVTTIVPGVKAPPKAAAKKGYGAGAGGKMKAAEMVEQYAGESSASGSDFEGPGISHAAKKAPPPQTQKNKKPTGAAAHKKNLAKAAANGASTTDTGTTLTSSASNKIGEGAVGSTKQVSQTTDGAVSDYTTSRTRRQRTKTGCWTCRGRKLKCDEGRPACGQCVRGRPRRDCVYPGDGEGEDDAPGEEDEGE